MSVQVGWEWRVKNGRGVGEGFVFGSGRGFVFRWGFGSTKEDERIHDPCVCFTRGEIKERTRWYWNLYLTLSPPLRQSKSRRTVVSGPSHVESRRLQTRPRPWNPDTLTRRSLPFFFFFFSRRNCDVRQSLPKLIVLLINKVIPFTRRSTLNVLIFILLNVRDVTVL